MASSSRAERRLILLPSWLYVRAAVVLRRAICQDTMRVRQRHSTPRYIDSIYPGSVTPCHRVISPRHVTPASVRPAVRSRCRGSETAVAVLEPDEVLAPPG